MGAHWSNCLDSLMPACPEGRQIHPRAGGALAPFLLPNGAEVALRRLERSVHHNGARGRIVGYDLHTTQYTVLISEDRAVAARYENLLQLVTGTLAGMQERPGLNGQAARVTGYDDSSGRYHVELLISRAPLAVRPHNFILPADARALVTGLTASPEWNGRIGAVLQYSPHDGRIDVDVGTKTLRVKPENLLL